MVLLAPKSAKEPVSPNFEPGHVGRVNAQLQSTPLSRVFDCGRCSPWFFPTRPPWQCRGTLPTEAEAAYASVLGLLLRTSFLYIRRPGAAVSPAGPPASGIAHFRRTGGCPSLSTRPLLHAPYVTHVSPAATAPLWAVPTPSAFRTERTVPPPTERRSLSLALLLTPPQSALTLTLLLPDCLTYPIHQGDVNRNDQHDTATQARLVTAVELASRGRICSSSRSSACPIFSHQQHAVADF